jgi:hypothetical protein
MREGMTGSLQVQQASDRFSNGLLAAHLETWMPIA